MATRIVMVPWALATPGDVFALAHNGALLAAPLTNIMIAMHCTQSYELRVQVKRYNSLPSAGDKAAPMSLADQSPGTGGEVYLPGFTLAGSPVLTIPDRCCSRSMAPHGILTDGSLGLARTHSLVLELLDEVPSAARGTPLQFVVRWDE